MELNNKYKYLNICKLIITIGYLTFSALLLLGELQNFTIFNFIVIKVTGIFNLFLGIYFYIDLHNRLKNIKNTAEDRIMMQFPLAIGIALIVISILIQI